MDRLFLEGVVNSESIILLNPTANAKIYVYSLLGERRAAYENCALVGDKIYSPSQLRITESDFVTYLYELTPNCSEYIKALEEIITAKWLQTILRMEIHEGGYFDRMEIIMLNIERLSINPVWYPRFSVFHDGMIQLSFEMKHKVQPRRSVGTMLKQECGFLPLEAQEKNLRELLLNQEIVADNHKYLVRNIKFGSSLDQLYVFYHGGKNDKQMRVRLNLKDVYMSESYMRKYGDNYLKKSIAAYDNMPIDNLTHRVGKLVNRIVSHPSIQTDVASWGIEMIATPVPEGIYSAPVISANDLTRGILQSSIILENWAVIAPGKYLNIAGSLVQCLKIVGELKNVHVEEPTPFNSRLYGTTLEAIMKLDVQLNEMQFILIIFDCNSESLIDEEKIREHLKEKLPNVVSVSFTTKMLESAKDMELAKSIICNMVDRMIYAIPGIHDNKFIPGTFVMLLQHEYTDNIMVSTNKMAKAMTVVCNRFNRQCAQNIVVVRGITGEYDLWDATFMKEFDRVKGDMQHAFKRLQKKIPNLGYMVANTSMQCVILDTGLFNRSDLHGLPFYLKYCNLLVARNIQSPKLGKGFLVQVDVESIEDVSIYYLPNWN